MKVAKEIRMAIKHDKDGETTSSAEEKSKD